MDANDVVFSKIAHALLVDYSSVYYVNAVTNEYHWFSIDPGTGSLKDEGSGEDFFQKMAKDAEEVIYEEDMHIFTEDIRKDRLMHKMKDGIMQNIVYRLMIDGKPVYHTLRMIRGVSEGDDYFILGVLNIDAEVRAKQEAEQLEREREIFNQIAQGLAGHYDTLYYIDMETDHYFEFSTGDTYKKMNIPTEGRDFFAESKKNVEKYVHPDDWDKVRALHRKDVLLENLQQKRTFSVDYRLIIEGETMYCRQSQMWASDKKHVLICVENINDEVAREERLKRTRAINVTYSQIAERLAEHYDTIYYVDAETEEYVEFSSTNLLQVLAAPAGGSDFFERAKENIGKVIYPEDRMRLHAFFNKELLLGGLQFPATRQIEYRLMTGKAVVYVRLSAMYTKDKRHLLFCVENIDEQVRALQSANELARTDELTGTHNKNAYQEMESSLQARIDAGEAFDFAIVVCDMNNLKRINDTLGHKTGDEYIRAVSKLVCGIFSHSPVFRIGGDEFVAVLTDSDYRNRDVLFAALRAKVLENMNTTSAPVVASGLSVYDPEVDHRVSDVFERADKSMYVYKRELKGMRRAT